MKRIILSAALTVTVIMAFAQTVYQRPGTITRAYGTDTAAAFIVTNTNAAGMSGALFVVDTDTCSLTMNATSGLVISCTDNAYELSGLLRNIGDARFLDAAGDDSLVISNSADTSFITSSQFLKIANTYLNGGKVGIGNSAPDSTLAVAGGAQLTGGLTAGGGGTFGGDTYVTGAVEFIGGNTFKIFDATGQDSLMINDDGDTAFVESTHIVKLESVYFDNATVGVGVAVPDSTLDVAGGGNFSGGVNIAYTVTANTGGTFGGVINANSGISVGANVTMQSSGINIGTSGTPVNNIHTDSVSTYALADLVSSKVEVLYTTNTAVGTDANTTEKTLASYTLPASNLDTDDDKIIIVAYGNFAATATEKTLYAYFGSSFLNTGAGIVNGYNWTLYGEISRTGSSAQDVYCAVEAAKNTGATAWVSQIAVQQNGTLTEDLSSTVSISVAGKNGTANSNDITLEGFTVYKVSQ